MYKDGRGFKITLCLDNIQNIPTIIRMCKMCVYKQLAKQAVSQVRNLFDLKVFLSVVDWQIFVNF